MPGAALYLGPREDGVVAAWAPTGASDAPPPADPAALGGWADAQAAALLSGQASAGPAIPPIPAHLLRSCLLEDAVDGGRRARRAPADACAAAALAGHGTALVAHPAGPAGASARLVALDSACFEDGDTATGWATDSTGSWSSDGESGESSSGGEEGGGGRREAGQ